MGCCGNNRSVIHSQSKYVLTLTPSEEIHLKASQFVTQNEGNIWSKYTICKNLGQGAFGRVILATMNGTNLLRAIKIIDKKRCPPDESEHISFKSEVELLKRIDHPNVIKIYEFYEYEAHYYIVMDYWSGGELFGYFVQQRWLTETRVAKIMLQLLGAIAHWHENGVVHWDLKPENIILESKVGKQNPEAVVKIVDFGTSSLIQPGQMLTHKSGTAFYVAPEVIDGEFDQKADIWSLGVITYLLLWGNPPFYGNSDQEILSKIKSLQFDFDSYSWNMISPEAKDFVSQILKPAESRITAVEAMQHPWMDTISTNDASQAVLKRTISNLTKFRADRQLQRAVLSFITNQMASNEELKEIENKFHAIDKNNDGRISKEELIEAYTQIYGQKYADEEVNQMMQEIDVDGNGFIDYSEFILAQADKKRALSEVNLKAAFDRFDGDGNGSISIDELKKVLGNQQTDEVLESIMKEVDLDGNGEIDIKEFQKMMFRKF